MAFASIRALSAPPAVRRAGAEALPSWDDLPTPPEDVFRAARRQPPSSAGSVRTPRPTDRDYAAKKLTDSSIADGVRGKRASGLAR